MPRRRRLLAAGALSLALPALHARGAYPNRAVRIIVPQPPGGGFDSVGRLMADRLGKLAGQGFVVENRTGSGTLVGTELAAKAAPDGYTLLVGSISNIALNPGLYASLPYDSLRDFEPVGLLVAYSYTLMARKDLPFKSLAEVIAHAKANPGKLTYASAGNGSGQHVLPAALWLWPASTSRTSRTAGRRRPTGTCWAAASTCSSTSRRRRGRRWTRATCARWPCPGPPATRCIRRCRPCRKAASRWSSNRGSGCSRRPRPRARCWTACAPSSRSLPPRPTCRREPAKGGGKPMALVGEPARALVQRDVEHWSKLVRTLAIKAE
ncbi:tripartite tricarboxylate transporter substrate binding protein [Ramlibacter terrae]|uniref:Tripartite tricarboxylate transporter substrate binding protein n=1 Tax=Ramlibacter terrae TaxID=2732511 RepID=A0ABX6P0M0_9BURK|nr:tripartite tricarboxylate transporter substrate binding protein [Ramlibacter terrae]